MNRIRIGVLAGVAGMMAGAAWADVPPAGEATLCNVTGLVVTVLQEEMASPALGKHVMVPVVGLEVESIAPVDAAYKGDFCAKAVPAAAVGAKAKGYYRLCDATAEFMTGQTIHGVVGMSRGGGRYCLANIQVQK